VLTLVQLLIQPAQFFFLLGMLVTQLYQRLLELFVACSNFSVDLNDIIVHEVVELDASYDPAFDFINDLLLQTPSLD
jgi:hypothetical protein